MKQPYANYFCQLLYIKLELSEQLSLLNIILSSFYQIIKNTISFNALISILENGLKSDCENLFSCYIKSLKEDFGKNSKLLRILESLINGFDYRKIAFIVEYIEENFMNLVKMRPGFFLIRKLLKTMKDEGTQLRMVRQIDMHIDEFVSTVNGSLLSQCLIRNFCLKECPYKGKSEFNDKLEQNIKKILESLKPEKQEKEKSLDNSLIDNEEKGESTEDYTNPALCLFYDILLNKVLFSSLNKHSSKILESALRYGGQIFHQKVLAQLCIYDFQNPLAKNSKLLYLISSERGLKFLKAAVEFMKEKDNLKLLSMINLCAEFISEKKKKELEAFVGVFKNSHISNCQLLPTSEPTQTKEEKVIESNFNNKQTKFIHSSKQINYNNQGFAESQAVPYQSEIEQNYRIMTQHKSTLNQGSSCNYNNEYSGKPGKFAVSKGQFHENNYAYGRFVYGDYSSSMGNPYISYNYTPSLIKQSYNGFPYDRKANEDNRLRKNSDYKESSRFKFAQVDRPGNFDDAHRGHLGKGLN